MAITFYHNPNCGTSRTALSIVRASGDAADGVEVVEYLVTPPDQALLAGLFARAGLTPRDGLRVKGNEALLAELGLAEPLADGDDARLLEAMVANPILINRPLVETPIGVVLARPSERVATVLRAPPASFTRASGEVVAL